MSYESFISRFPTLKNAVEDLPANMKKTLEEQPEAAVKFLEEISFLKTYAGPPVMLYMPLEYQQQMQFPYSLVRQSWNAAMNEFLVYLSIIDELNLLKIQNQRMKELLAYYLSRFYDNKKDATDRLNEVFRAMMSDKPAKNILDMLSNLPSQVHELQALKYRLTNEIVIPKAVEALAESYSEQYLDKHDPDSEEYKQHAEIAERFDEIKEKLEPEKREEIIQFHRDVVEQEYEDAGEEISESELEYRAQHKFNLGRNIELLGIFRDAEKVEFGEAAELEQTGIIRKAKEIVEAEIERQNKELGLDAIDDKLDEIQQSKHTTGNTQQTRRGRIPATNHFSTAPKWLSKPDDALKEKSRAALEKLTYHIAQVEKMGDVPEEEKDVFYTHAASLVNVLDGIDREQFTIHNDRIIQVEGAHDVTATLELIVKDLARLAPSSDMAYLQEACETLGFELPSKEETATLAETAEGSNSANAAVFSAEHKIEDAVEAQVEAQEASELNGGIDFEALIALNRELYEKLHDNSSDSIQDLISVIKDFEQSPSLEKLDSLMDYLEAGQEAGMSSEAQGIVKDCLDLIDEIQEEHIDSPSKGL